MNEPRMVRVEWYDASRVSGDFTAKDAEEFILDACVDVGFLIDENPDRLILAASLNGADHPNEDVEDDAEYRGLVAIPSALVRRVDDLQRRDKPSQPLPPPGGTGR